MKRFEGKTVLITGGNSGMGFTTAKRIVQEGGKVIITGRDEKTLKTAAQELGPNAEAVRSDVSNLKDIEALAALVQKKYGKIDGLFANAGIAKFGPVESVTPEQFDEQFNVNVKGVFFTMQKLIPLLNKGGAVLVNASVAASAGSAANSVYAATKAAVRSMSRTFSAAFVEKGVRVNTLSPGPIETPIWDRPGGVPNVDAVKAAITESNPMKRYGTADEIASVAAFLLSEDSSYMLGAEIFVDGGANQL